MVAEGTQNDRTAETAEAADDAGSTPETVDAKTAAAVAAAGGGGSAERRECAGRQLDLVGTAGQDAVHGAAACRGGHVRVNGERVKPSHSVRVGDEVRVRVETRERVVVVKRLIRKRVGAPVAVHCYIDNSPPPPPREAVAPAGIRDRGAGRPTKRDRRELERLRALGGPGPFGGFAAPPAPVRRAPRRAHAAVRVVPAERVAAGRAEVDAEAGTRAREAHPGLEARAPGHRHGIPASAGHRHGGGSEPR